METIEIEGENYLTAEEAARILGVKPSTLYAYASRGRLRSFRQGMKRRSLYRLADIEELIELAPARSARGRIRIPRAEEWVPYTG